MSDQEIIAALVKGRERCRQLVQFYQNLHAATEAFYIRVAQGDVLGCLPGSTGFLVSTTVKNNFLVFRKGGEF